MMVKFKHCIICHREVRSRPRSRRNGPFNGIDGGAKGQVEALRQFFRLFGRHLDVDLNLVPDDKPGSDGSDVDDDKELSRTGDLFEKLANGGQFQACPECSKVVDSFNQLYNQLREVELLVNWKVWTLQNLMSNVDKVPVRIKMQQKAGGGAEVTGDGDDAVTLLSNLRRDLVKKCVRKLKGTFPRLELDKCQSQTASLQSDVKNEEDCSDFESVGDRYVWDDNQEDFEQARPLISTEEVEVDVPEQTDSLEEPDPLEDDSPNVPPPIADPISGKWKCAVAVCGKEFGQRSSYDRHHLIHLVVKAFRCHVCGWRFRLKQHLSGHLKNPTACHWSLKKLKKRKATSSKEPGHGVEVVSGTLPTPDSTPSKEEPNDNLTETGSGNDVRNSSIENPLSERSPDLVRRPRGGRTSQTVRLKRKSAGGRIRKPVVSSKRGTRTKKAPRPKHSCILCGKDFLREARLRIHLTAKHFPSSNFNMDKLNHKEELKKGLEDVEEVVLGDGEEKELGAPEPPPLPNIVNIATPTTAPTESESPEPAEKPNYIFNPTTKKFSCCHCHKQYRHLSNWELHYRNHGQLRYECRLCNKQFKSRTNYNLHHKTTHANVRFRCRRCDKLFKHRYQLRQHQRANCRAIKEGRPSTSKWNPRRMVDESDSFYTPVAPKDSPEGEETPQWTFNSETNIYTCAHCPKQFPKLQTCKSHFFSCHRERVRCTLCQMEFGYRGSFRIHYRNIHQGITHPCPKCQRIFKLKYRLTLHLRKSPVCGAGAHVKPVRFTCPICEKDYSTGDTLKKHLAEVHSGKKREPKHLCSECGTWFMSAQGLQRHLKFVHSDAAREHLCHLCGMEFKLKYHLQRHHRVVHLKIKRNSNSGMDNVKTS